MVQYLESERVSARGHKLFSVTYLPDAAEVPPVPSAVLVWHHGVAEHVGRYHQLFLRFAEQGIAVYAGDVVGHGKSEGSRAVIMSYKDAVDELLALGRHAAQDVAARYPGTSPAMFLTGHSLGGLIAALACLRDQAPWAGLMLCSPALGMQMGLKLRIQAAVARMISACFPSARLVEAVDPYDMNPDHSVVEEGLNDPLITFGKLPVCTASQALKGMSRLRRHWREIQLPLWVHHGDADKCTSPAASKAFVEAAGSKDKTLVLVPGGYHEVLFTKGVAEALQQQMIGWIREHASTAGPAARVAAAGIGAA